MDFEIRPLGEDVYLVAGRVIWVRHGAFDNVSPAMGCYLLAEQAAAMEGTHLWPRPYGDMTAAMIFPQDWATMEGTFLVEPCHMARMPESVKAILRKEFPEYAEHSI